jgi:hypothetical protein
MSPPGDAADPRGDRRLPHSRDSLSPPGDGASCRRRCPSRPFPRKPLRYLPFGRLARMWLFPFPGAADAAPGQQRNREMRMDIVSKRGKLLALVAPGLIAIEAGPAPWIVAASTEDFRPRLARTAPGCTPARVGRLVQHAPAGEADDYFSTKARSIT